VIGNRAWDVDPSKDPQLQQPLKRQQSVWVAAPSDEVHSTQELLEVRQGSQGMGRVGETRESSGVQSLQDCAQTYTEERGRLLSKLVQAYIS